MRTVDRSAGFSLVELAIVMAGMVLLASIVTPRISSVIKAERASRAGRQVERELQSARLRAVSLSRSLRVKFNCPASGQLRTLEYTGVLATDTSTSRCSAAVFPSPGPVDTLQSTPAYDGPVQHLPTGTTVTGTALDILFSPQGTVFTVANGVATRVTSDLVVTVTRENKRKTVTINALGRIKLS